MDVVELHPSIVSTWAQHGWFLSGFVLKEVNQSCFKGTRDIYGLLPLEREEQLEGSSISLEM